MKHQNEMPLWAWALGGGTLISVSVGLLALRRMERMAEENRLHILEQKQLLNELNSSFTNFNQSLAMGSYRTPGDTLESLGPASANSALGSRQGSILRASPSKKSESRVQSPSNRLQSPNRKVRIEETNSSAVFDERKPEASLGRDSLLSPGRTFRLNGEKSVYTSAASSRVDDTSSAPLSRKHSFPLRKRASTLKSSASSPNVDEFKSTEEELGARAQTEILGEGEERKAPPMKVFSSSHHEKFGCRKRLKSEQRDLLRSLHFFHEAPDEFFLSIEDDLKPETHPEGEIIGREGDYGDRMFFIAKGTVLGFRRGKKHVYHEGEYFGELAVMRGMLRSSTFTASTPTVELYSLSRTRLLTALFEFPTVRDSIELLIFQRLEEEKYPEARREEPDIRKRIQINVAKMFKQFKEYQKKKTEFFIKGKLGNGASGEVYSGFSKMTGLPLAVKKIHIPGHKPKHHQLAVEMESQIMQRMQHPNVIQGYGMQKDSQEKDTYYILMEIAPLGSVESLIKSQGSLTEPAARNYCRQLLLGLQYLHKNGVLHRDLKPSNLLLASDGSVKLADFGISKLMDQSVASSTNIKGTPAYMAPDAINGKFSIASDIWAVGCCVLEMITGKPPWSQHHFDCPTQLIFHIATCNASPKIPKVFERENSEELWLTRRASSILQEELSHSTYRAEEFEADGAEEDGVNALECSPQLASLLMHMLALDPAERGDCATCLAHDWFAVDESQLISTENFSFTHAPVPTIATPPNGKTHQPLAKDGPCEVYSTTTSSSTGVSPNTTASLTQDAFLHGKAPSSFIAGERHEMDAAAGGSHTYHSDTLTFEMSGKKFKSEESESFS